jgi:hypothetical protein
MSTSSKNTTRCHKHHAYYDSQPDSWNIETFVKAIYPTIIGGQRPPEPSTRPDWMQKLQRTIFSSWASHLGHISSCQRCDHPRQKRARVLLSDFNKKNSVRFTISFPSVFFSWALQTPVSIMLHKAGFMFTLCWASSAGIMVYETVNRHAPGLSIWTSRTCECTPLSDFLTWCGEDLRLHSFATS